MKDETYGGKLNALLTRQVEMITEIRTLKDSVSELVDCIQGLANELSNQSKAQRNKTPPKSKEFRMPFGKHKGLTFDEIESEDGNYLDWIEENMDNERVQEELAKWKGI